MNKKLIASLALMFSVGLGGTSFAAVDTDYTAEIEALKQRIADLEKKANEKPKAFAAKRDDGLKLGGDFRIRYIDDHSGDTSVEQRVRLELQKKIDKNASFYGRWYVMNNNEMGRTINDTSGLNDTRDYPDFDAKDKNQVSDAYIEINKFMGSPNTLTFGRFGQDIGATKYWSSAGSLGMIDGIKADIGKKQNVTVGFANWSPASSYATYSSKKSAEENFHKKLEDTFFVNGKFPVSKATDIYGMWVKEQTGDNSDYDVRGLGFKTDLADNLKLYADYTRNYAQENDPKGYYISMRYKGANDDKPHSWGLRAEYRFIETGNMYTTSLTGSSILPSSNIKGPAVSLHWAPAKNFLIEGFQTFDTKKATTGEGTENYTRLQVMTSF